MKSPLEFLMPTVRDYANHVTLNRHQGAKKCYGQIEEMVQTSDTLTTETTAILRQVIQDADASANGGTLDWLTVNKVRELLARLHPEAPQQPTNNQPPEPHDE